MKDRRLAIIFSVVLVDMLSFSIVLPLMAYIARDLGATKFQAGLLLAMYPLAQFFGAPILGRLSDRFGRKPVLLVSIFGTMCGFIVLGLANSLAILFVSRFVDGITGGNISVAQAYISDITTPESRGKALGMIGAAFGLGFIIGPATGGILSGYGYAVPAFVGAGLAALNLVLVTLFVPESLTAEDKARLAARKRPMFDVSGLREALGHPRVGPLLGVRAGTGLAFSIFEGGFSLWAVAIGITQRANGLVLAYVGVLSVLIQLFAIGWLTKRFSDDVLLLGSLSLAAVALAGWGFMPGIPPLLLYMPLLSLGLAVSNTILTSALTKSVHHDEVGGILGIQTSIQSLTRIPAPIIAGALIGSVAVWAPGVLAGAIAAGCAVLAYSRLCWRPGKQACVEEEATG
jgi:DHA1 family tetracycline resistance protein-like MFS transporter